MLDARIFTKELETARKILALINAVFKGEYIIHDAIYKSKDSNQDIDKVFLRLRYISKNIWNEKSYIVVIKHTELKEIGKQSIIPVKEEFDSEKEAKEFIDKNYSGDFEFLYEFDRMGWQYDIGDDQIDLEDIEGHFSIEFKSPDEEGLRKLLKLFDVKNVIRAPSVVIIRELLRK